MIRSWFGKLTGAQRADLILRGAAIIFFLWLTGRFWDPYHGFTRFLQFDATDEAVMLPELRDTPLYIYRDTGGYDGASYAQVAVRPLGQGAELDHAVKNLPYRARRILLGWIAHGLAGGDPWRTVQVFAALNLAVWLLLAGVLGWIFPLGGARNFVAWGGLLFSAGALHSVRLAVPDLAALLLIAVAAMLAEKKRGAWATGFMAAAGLARDTALLGVAALWESPVGERWMKNIFRTLLVALPLGLWALYLNLFVSSATPGLDNFAAPLAGWWWKLRVTAVSVSVDEHPWLAITTMLTLFSLTVQAAYLAWRPQVEDSWWRLGAIHVALMLCLAPVVWEGHPGAAARVLLPLGLAFNVIAARGRAHLAWIVAGNLSFFSGVLALWQVPADLHGVATGRTPQVTYAVRTDTRWYSSETGGDGKVWAWNSGAGALQIETWARISAERKVQLRLRAIDRRRVEIRQIGKVLWAGELDERAQWIELPAVQFAHGRAELSLVSPVAPHAESAGAGGRQLSFAIYGARVVEGG